MKAQTMSYSLCGNADLLLGGSARSMHSFSSPMALTDGTEAMTDLRCNRCWRIYRVNTKTPVSIHPRSLQTVNSQQTGHVTTMSFVIMIADGNGCLDNN